MKVTKTFKRFWHTKKRIVIHRGGTSSGKTRANLQALAIWLFTGRIRENLTIEKGVASVVRQYAAELNKSVIREFREILLEDFNVKNLKEIENKTERTFTVGGRLVEFFGADDPEKLKGPRRDILFCNEANNLSYSQAFFQLNIRTRKLVILDFNPDDEDVWINSELEQKRAMQEDDVEVLVSTFRDNAYISKMEVKEILNIRNIDPQLWKVYGNGEYGKLEGAIFQDIIEINSVPPEANFIARGMDFGYTNDPTTLIAVYKRNGGIIFDEEIFSTGLTNQDIIGEFKNIGFERSLEIFADSAEPKSIEEIYRGGYNVQGVKKGKDSINYGITTIKEQGQIYITGRSTNLRKEFKKYIWAKDKEGKPTNQPIDKFNHCIDALRYACMMKFGKKLELNITIG